MGEGEIVVVGLLVAVAGLSVLARRLSLPRDHPVATAPKVLQLEEAFHRRRRASRVISELGRRPR